MGLGPWPVSRNKEAGFKTCAGWPVLLPRDASKPAQERPARPAPTTTTSTSSSATSACAGAARRTNGLVESGRETDDPRYAHRATATGPRSSSSTRAGGGRRCIAYLRDRSRTRRRHCRGRIDRYKSYRCSDNERESKVTVNIFHCAHGTGTVGGGQKLVSRSAMHTRDHLTWFREGIRCAEFHHLDIRGEVLAIGARIEQRAAGAP